MQKKVIYFGLRHLVSATADGDKQYLKHSIVSRVSAIDRDADGLIDNIYFGDLGGQVTGLISIITKRKRGLPIVHLGYV